jgi:NADH dehydrogenase (ubiquinone) Fe-S protein 1
MVNRKSKIYLRCLNIQRLTSPLIKIEQSNSYIKSSWFKIKRFLKFSFSKYKNFKILPIIGDGLDLEYIYYIKKYLNTLGINYYFNNTDFLKSFNNVGSINLDVRSDYLLKITDWSKVNTCLLLNFNLRLENPLINSKLRQEYIWNNLNIFFFGSKYNLTYKYYQISNNLQEFIKFIEGRTWLNNVISKNLNII